MKFGLCTKGELTRPQDTNQIGLVDALTAKPVDGFGITIKPIAIRLNDKAATEHNPVTGRCKPAIPAFT